MNRNKTIVTAIIIAALIATAIGITIAVQSARAEKPLSAAEMLSLGEKYLLELDYEQAIVHFTSLIEIEPKNVRAYTGLAEAYLGAGDADKAVDALRQGLEQLPDNAEITDMLDRLIAPEPTPESSPAPVETPTPDPTETPAPEPTTEPTEEPTSEPTDEYVTEPALGPSEEPVSASSEEPTPTPTLALDPISTQEPVSGIPDNVKEIFVQLVTAFENEDYNEVWRLSGDTTLVDYIKSRQSKFVKYKKIIATFLSDRSATHCRVEYWGHIDNGFGVWYNSFPYRFDTDAPNSKMRQKWEIIDVSQYEMTGHYSEFIIEPDRSLAYHTHGEIINGQLRAFYIDFYLPDGTTYNNEFISTPQDTNYIDMSRQLKQQETWPNEE